MDAAFNNGFLTKCAERNVPAHVAFSMLKQAIASMGAMATMPHTPATPIPASTPAAAPAQKVNTPAAGLTTNKATKGLGK